MIQYEVPVAAVHVVSPSPSSQAAPNTYVAKRFVALFHECEHSELTLPCSTAILHWNSSRSGMDEKVESV